MLDPALPKPVAMPARALSPVGILALVAVLVLLVVVAGAAIWQSNSNSTVLEAALLTRDQRNGVTAVLRAVQDAETAQRGFLLSGNAEYLAPLTAAERDLPGLLGAVGTAAGDEMAMRLRALVTTRMAQLQHTVTLAQGGDMAAAIAFVRSDLGRTAMIAIRDQVTQMEQRLDGSLQRQMRSIYRGGRLLIAIDVAGLVMVLALIGLVALGLRGYLRTMRAAQQLAAQANHALEQSNERLDEIVRSRTADLSAANEEIQRFAYIVSHDLRSPLVNIMGFTSELEQAAGVLGRHFEAAGASVDVQAAVAEDIPEALRFIKTSTSKMDRLINAILKLSREGRRVLLAERLDMAALLRGIEESLQHQMLAKEASIEIGSTPDITADRLAVEQIFTNIVDNALKYLRPGVPGSIRIHGEAEGDMVRFAVADNGRGIAEADYDRVFDLFRRAGDQSTPGEGIGLAHVRALVRRLGGRITCASELGAGTVFTVRLPRMPRPGMEATA